MASQETALSASGFINSIGINVHMDYTDGAYASEPNVASDLAYLGIKYIRDGLSTDTASIPVQNQITALNELAAQGIKFDLGIVTANVQSEIAAANALEVSSPGAIFALEGPNEINNWPITYDGLTGQAAAIAVQTAYYAAVKADPSLRGVSVFNFTGGAPPVLTPHGTLTQNANGSFTLVDGITGWLASLPPGVTTIDATYTGTAPWGGVYGSPGANQQGGLSEGVNGEVSFTYDNNSTEAQNFYISFSDWNSTTTITGLSAVSGTSGNLVAFDPNMSLAGMADYSNTHPYPSHGAEPGSYITTSDGLPVPGPSVITEDGYDTDPNDPNGVSQTVQAQDDVKILLDAYNAGVSQTYLYELLDEKPDPSNTDSEMHFGVFNNNNTPKQAAVAIHDLTTILSAGNTPVSGFTPGTLAWSATGLPTTASTMLLEKTNGAFDLAVWNEPTSASAGTANVTVALGATYGTVEVFDPITGSAPISTLTNASQVTLSLGQDPLIVEVEPASYLNVARLSPAQIGKLTMAQIHALNATQIAAMTSSQIAALSKTQIAALPAADFAAMSASQLAAIQPAAFADLTKADTAAINPTILLAAAQMRFLAAASPTAASAANIAALSLHDAMSLLESAGQILSPGHTDTMSAAQITMPAIMAIGHTVSTMAQSIAISHVNALTTAREAALFH